MFKDIQSGLNKFLGNRWLPIIIIIAICIVLMFYSSTKNNVFDRMSTGDETRQNMSRNFAGPVPQPVMSDPPQQQGSGGYTTQQVAQPGDLLPQDQNSQWANLNPIGNGAIAMPDLLQAGYHIGLDTIGQTLKNANLQLRSDPIIEKKDIGPWNQSTYEADYGRVPLEVGVGPR